MSVESNIGTKSDRLPAEFRLVAACCHWPPSPRRDALVGAAGSGEIDWNLVLQIADRQRVNSLVADGLVRSRLSVPSAVTDVLSSRTAAVSRLSLLQAAESVRLQEMFDADGIPTVILKGSALAVLAYGNLGMKHSWDIDLLVAKRDAAAARRILQVIGYVGEAPPDSFDDERFREWTQIAHESGLRNPTSGLHVELHWRLCSNAALLAEVSPQTDFQSVAIGGNWTLRTLGDESLYAYLCLHGARHGWSRLKWLADLAAWIGQKPPEEIERLHRVALARHVGRASGQALLLSNALFGTSLPTGLAAEIRADRLTRWLVAISLDSMAGTVRQIEDRRLGTLVIASSHLLLATGWTQFVQELRAKSVGWNEFQDIRLPRFLYVLYPFLRFPAWLWRHGRRLMQQR